jgi:hypothetical protein
MPELKKSIIFFKNAEFKDVRCSARLWPFAAVLLCYAATRPQKYAMNFRGQDQTLRESLLPSHEG